MELASFHITAQIMKFFIKGFFSKCDQIRRKLSIWRNLLKKFLMENFIFCLVDPLRVTERDQWHEMGQGASNLYPNADDTA